MSDNPWYVKISITTLNDRTRRIYIVGGVEGKLDFEKMLKALASLRALYTTTCMDLGKLSIKLC